MTFLLSAQPTASALIEAPVWNWQALYFSTYRHNGNWLEGVILLFLVSKEEAFPEQPAILTETKQIRIVGDL